MGSTGVEKGYYNCTKPEVLLQSTSVLRIDLQSLEVELGETPENIRKETSNKRSKAVGCKKKRFARRQLAS
ncbi:hypothetical protein SLEP1_g51433 [Rubroshorea leprosula]|uniref:Uncharacterized protein n=1 Tax=Rubroshorea leprosula TaxID=152421 RepID=A0AAV5M3Z1_9ROSI|nr:hypothetical protein SLEP1_g51433 [Rubroshorea leprosula]